MVKCEEVSANPVYRSVKGYFHLSRIGHHVLFVLTRSSRFVSRLVFIRIGGHQALDGDENGLQSLRR